MDPWQALGLAFLCDSCRLEYEVTLEYGPFGTDYEGEPIHADAGAVHVKRCNKCKYSKIEEIK